MKYFKLLSLIFTVLYISKTEAQQDPNFTMYNFNMNIINPAYAGANEFTEISLAYRSQWIGVPNAPETQTLTYSQPLKNNMGIGVSIINDKVFVLAETDVAVDFSYKVQLTKNESLTFGIKAGGAFTNIDLTNAGAPELDPLFGSNESAFNPQIGAGFHLKSQNYYISISTPNFLNGKRYEKDGNVPIAALNAFHTYLGGGYIFTLNKSTTLTPGIMARVVEGAPTSYDVFTTFDFNQRATAGVNYRVDESVSLYALMSTKNNFRFGLGYDISTSKLYDSNNASSIELILKYKWN
ncbi:type IX secretion system membrane protein PorP/SprF [Flavicella sp.]|uniref:PorP/SprF family type IX secretion system membrane protein n=1 Tax=Flavicella sp. TaxID=2957742 RepID=UPI0026303783|nr:type IX secretion system membrane protein PorP/SprF [Flavicella sp.]MDG1804039.1 type IX secretion system membrane protein PorP/SprF [Flavicella sp.]